MIELACPECGAENSYREQDLFLFAHVACENCGALLEVIEEAPFVMEAVEDDLTDEDDFDDDDESDV